MKRFAFSALLLAATVSAQTDHEIRIRRLEGFHNINVCGNGVLEPDFQEACDGAELGGETCQGQGFDSGMLACAPNCAYDTSACSIDPPPPPEGGTWTALGGGTFAQHFNCFGYPVCGPVLTIKGQSGGVWDPNAQCLVLFGGGHADSRYSGVDRYCIGTQTWENLFPPQPIIDPNVCNPVDANGDPVSRHSYGMGVFVPSGGDRPNDVYWHYGGSAACHAGTFQRDVWTFDLVTHEWTPHGDNLPNNPGGQGAFPSCEYDPLTEDIFCMGATNGWFNVWRWDLQAKTWSRLFPVNTIAFPMVFSTDAVIVNSPGSPLDRKMVVANSERFWNGAPSLTYAPDLVVVNLDGPAIVEHIVPTGGGIETVLSMAVPSVAGWNTPGLAWDPVRKTLVMWSGVSSEVSPSAIYVIDPATWITARLDVPGGPAYNNNRGVYGRFVWTGTGFLEVHDAHQPPYFFQFEE